MFQKLREILKFNRCGAERKTLKKRPKRQIKVRYSILALLLVGIISVPRMVTTNAVGCPDVKVVFARGSGSERWKDQNYSAYKNAIEAKLATTTLSYEFVDLDYPAVGINNIGVLIGAAVGAGDAYEFGASVDAGVRNLMAMVNGDGCWNTKYVLGGYSQGAMVVSKALGSLNADRLIYAATFGDPKLYLPEGKGLIPAACRGENLSDYRIYVPDCKAYKGLLGAYIPYEPNVLAGKVGTWCNKRDIFCSSHLNISDHTSYVAENLYEDASRVIFDKICSTFSINNTVSSPHDTAILIDSTGSMNDMIAQYKAEALRLAQETLSSGGRVALYDYRDLSDPYTPVQHCNFETCTLDVFTAELNEIEIDGGGDTPESLLSASLHVMKNLEWKYGSTKSLVVLTDANFLSPDRDGVTFDEVVTLSKRIDPVNFYIITNDVSRDWHNELAEATGGKVVTNFDELSLLTDYIMERYDSLPRVEESSEIVEVPTLSVKNIVIAGDTATVDFVTDGEQVLLVLNDAILGITEVVDGVGPVTISGLDSDTENVLTLIPLREDVRGEGVSVELRAEGVGRGAFNEVVMPTIKVPNTGKN